MDDIAEAWTGNVDVTHMTDTDLTQSRNHNTNISDASGELHQLVETCYLHGDYDDVSLVCDRALRVELAGAIDEGRVGFTRDSFDVAFLVPPKGWVDQQNFSHVELTDDPPDEWVVDPEDRLINVSVPPVVYEMAQQAVDDGPYDSVSDVVRAGIERQLGRL